MCITLEIVKLHSVTVAVLKLVYRRCFNPSCFLRHCYTVVDINIIGASFIYSVSGFAVDRLGPEYFLFFVEKAGNVRLASLEREFETVARETRCRVCFAVNVSFGQGFLKTTTYRCVMVSTDVPECHI